MSRSQQDTVIDDDEETCPLCIEEFDLSDKNFRPCPCGYQICQFCFNSLKTTYEKSTCPNCRRVYDEKTIQYKIPTAEEFKLDQQNKLKKQAASKRKESEKREVETSSRRNLAGVRVKQQNLVYVIGLVPSIKDENVLLQTLRGPEYFGQYGEIEKIVVSKAKPGAVNQGVGVYVTYTTKEAAATCINAVDGSMNGDRVLRAQFGTTKYCSAYLRGETCNNKNCSFLHETGEEGQGTTLQHEPMQTKAAQRPPYTNQASQYQPQIRQSQPVPPSTASSTSSSQPMVRQSSKEESNSRKGSTDASALPSSVSWANPNAPVIRTRRTSQAASRSSPSPQISNATVASQKPEENKQDETSSTPTRPLPPSSSTPPVPSPANNAPSKTASVPQAKNELRKRRDSVLDDLIASVNSPEFRFIFNDSAFSPEELTALERNSVMIDPSGGARLRLKREREDAERAKQEAEAQLKTQSSSQNQPSVNEEAVDDEPFESGSLALGGEPEENPRSIAARSAIQRPSQPTATNTFLHDQFSALNGRSLTPQQRQQISLMGSSNLQQAPGLGHQPFGASAFEFEQRHGMSQAQAHHESFHGHARQHSRFNFSNDSAKLNTARYPTQQPSAGSQHFYTSGVQGPPPGLKTAGTPPISGGGMFAQGHGFTSNMSAGFGTVKDNTDMLMRGRSGTNTGHDVSKREYLLSLQNTNLRSPPPSAPGLLNPLYGQYTGAYQDPGLVKQKKKGKKHRHANTSSSGGGVVDLADPSILQARLHQSGAGAGQGLFGGQNQDDIDFPPLAPIPVPRVSDTANTLRSHIHSVRSSQDSTARSSTPKIPPGLSLPHGHPSTAHGHGVSTLQIQQKPTPATPGPVTPAVPVFPIGPRVPTPKVKARDDSSVEVRAAKEEANNVKCDDSKPDDAVITVSQKPGDSTSALHWPKNTRTSTVPTDVDVGVNIVIGRMEKRAIDYPSAGGDSPPSMDLSAKSVPEKLDLPSAREAKPPSALPSPVADEAPVLAASIVATPPALSRPGTPATAACRTPESSALRPKTIRITSTTSQKADPAPASAVAGQSTSLPSALGKQRSRQPSVSSVSHSRPSTPAISDHVDSNDVSRASSPPPSAVGSAPERSKSKHQIRNERKSKGKDTTETNSDGPPTPVERKVEEQQPIIARQKKKKRKTADRGTADDDSSPTVPADNVDRKMPAVVASAKGTKPQSHKNTKPAGNSEHGSERADDTVAETEPEKKTWVPVAGKEDKVPSSSAPKEPYTLNQLLIESGKANDPEAFKTLLDEHISNIQTLFSQLFDTKQLDQSSALFNLPPLTSYRLPPDSRRGADYLDGNGYTMSSPFGVVYVDSKQKKELQQGSAVRISDPNRPNDLLRRTLITKNGRVYRHLSQEEEERVLALERKREEDEQRYGELSAKDMSKVDDDDLMNIQGGLDELLKHGDRHGISWVINESEHAGPDDEDDADYTLANGEPGDLATIAGGWQAVDLPGSMPAAANRKDHSAARPPAQTKSLNLRAMDLGKLQRTIKETQMEMEQARKEMEAAEKKWGKKGKEAAKWRDGMLKGKVMVGPDGGRGDAHCVTSV